mgnify:CR=1 FL=1
MFSYAMKYTYMKDFIFYPIFLWIYNWILKVTAKNIEYYLSNENHALIKANNSDACYDIQSNEFYEIFPGERKLISTKLFFKLPLNWEAQIRSRSGNANNHGIMVLNSPGTIDSGYRNEVKVILYNTGVDTFNIVPGDRIAQVKFDKVPRTNLKRSNINFSINTDRGQKGFGSSGK